MIITPTIFPSYHRTHAASATAPTRRRTKRPFILLIEDDRMIAEMYRLQLEREGYEVQHALDGAQGLEVIKTLQPDLVLLDLRLPVMEGFEVLERLQQEPPDTRNIPVLILSNYGDTRMIRRGMELGAQNYLVKSATTPVLLAAMIRSLLAPPDPTHL